MDAFSEFDWNLLKCAEALFAERNVTRAAARVGLSQPAMSRALGRLRVVFGDELLVRAGRGMELTPRAEALIGTLQEIREQLQEALSKSGFDPQTSSREFSLYGADYAELTLLPHLMRLLSREAPHVTIKFVHSLSAPEELVGLREVDLVLNPRFHEAGSHVVGQKLFDEEFACIVRTGHPSIKQRLSLKKYCSLSHVLVAPRARPGGIVDSSLEKLGRKRHVSVLVQSFLSAPEIVAQTDLIATFPLRLATLSAKRLPLRVLPPPLELPGFTMMQYWNVTKSDDPAHRFLRTMVEKAAQRSS